MKKISKTTLTSGAKTPIIFFGSGPVAAKSLELLLKHQEVEAIVTKPSTVKQMTAVAQGICVHSVNSRADLDDLILAQPFSTSLGVLIDFGIIVSQKVIDSFEHGIINSHFSLLPQLRGADPISFAILEGLNKTGVSLMVLVEAMDEGPIIACGVQELTNTETTPELTDKLILLSDALLKKELPRYWRSESKGIEQAKLASLIPDHPKEPTYSRKLTKTDGILDFTKPSTVLEREIRAFIEWPKSRTALAGKDVVITKAHDVPSNFSDTPGDIDVVPDIGSLMIQCSDGYLCIDALKPAGKKEMTAKAFLAGYGSRLGGKVG